MKRISKLLALFLTPLALTSYANGDDSQILEIVATNYPPYEFATPENGLKGFDVEVVEEAFNRMGTPVKVTFHPWAKVMETTFAGEVMAALTCGKNKTRDPFISYSLPISQGTQGYFYKKTHSFTLPKEREKLGEFTISTVSGYGQTKQLETLNIPNRAVKNDLEAIELLVKEEVDISFIPYEATAFRIREENYTDEINYMPLKVVDHHLCFSKKWPNYKEIMKQFNRTLAKMKADGSYKKIHARYR